VTGNKPLGQNLVGRQSDGSVLTAQNQFVSPAGDTIEQTGQPMDLEVRPDGGTAVSLTKSGSGLFTVVDLASQKVLQQLTPPKGTGSGDIGVGGLLYSKDGNTLWATQSKNILKFTVAADGTLTAPVAIPLPTTGPGTTPTSANGTPASPLPSDLTWTADHTAILVVLDGYNRLAQLDPVANTVTAIAQTGVGPRDVVVIGTHAFVSNEAGRQPTAQDFTNLSYDSRTVAEQQDGRANDGTVSEIDLGTRAVVHTYQVGLDPSSMVVHGTDLLVTNSSDDTVSVIDTAARAVTQTINVNPLPGQPYGSSPNALAFIDPSFADNLFTDKPNFTPFTALPNQIPLDTLNPSATSVSNPMQKEWIAWSDKQDFRREDALAFAPFNRLTWYSGTGWKRPYPGDTKVMTPDEVESKFPQTVDDDDEPAPVSRAETPHTAGH
jgi:YVTN family beta-propeller protein